MGKLKDALYMEVWKHLRALPQCRTLLLALNAPATGPKPIREAWATLKENGKDEGMKKATGLQTVLMERSDLFQTQTNERGHLLICLTPSAQDMNPDDGLPPSGTLPSSTPSAPSSGLAEQLAALSSPDSGGSLDPVIAAQFADALKAVEEQGWSESGGLTATTEALLASSAPKIGGAICDGSEGPPAKKQKVAKGKGKGQGGKGPNGWYTDIIWTPELKAKQDAEKVKDAQLARSLFNACEQHGGQSVTLSQLGSDFTVAALKKDNQYKNYKLVDILRWWEDVFEMVPDGVAGGYVVRLQPGAEAALPDSEWYTGPSSSETDLMLPERLEDPRSLKERMQALRIELVHALHRRGGAVPLQELGQEPRVQKVKSGLHKAQKLIEFIRQFPSNFNVTSDSAGQMVINVSSFDVHDQSMIDNTIVKTQIAAHQHRDKGKGRGPPPSRSSSHQPAPPPVSHDHYRGDLGYGQRGDMGYGHMQAHHAAALAHASAVNTLVQHSIASAYGGASPYGAAYAGYPPAHPVHPGYPASPPGYPI